MFRHIAVAVDFSAGADVLLRSLPGLRELGAERLTLIHVARLESPVTGWVTHLDYYRQRLEAFRPALERQGFSVRTVAVSGNPAREIVRIAEECGASLVLVGARSNTAVPGAFLGSVGWDIVRRTSLPVLVQRVEPDARARDGTAKHAPGGQTHVLFPTDFSDASEAAFRVVEALARAGVVSFSLLHVQEDEVEPWLAREDARECSQRLTELAGRLRKAGAHRVDVQMLSGTPADELLRYAEEARNVLVVLGTRARGWLSELLRGSVSHEVFRRADASVLIVPVPSGTPAGRR